MSAAPEGATVVIGVGSPLMGDDGIGLRALAELDRCASFSPHVELLDGGTWGMNLLPFIEAAERVLILDAIDAGRPPGTRIRLEDEGLPRFLATKVSPHQIDLREVLALAALRGTLPTLVALGVQPAVVEMRTELSDVVEARIPELVADAIACLEAWGHAVVTAEPETASPGLETGAPRVGTVPADAANPPCTR